MQYFCAEVVKIMKTKIFLYMLQSKVNRMKQNIMMWIMLMKKMITKKMMKMTKLVWIFNIR